jgi:hypothetical protein
LGRSEKQLRDCISANVCRSERNIPDTGTSQGHIFEETFLRLFEERVQKLWYWGFSSDFAADLLPTLELAI